MLLKFNSSQKIIFFFILLIFSNLKTFSSDPSPLLELSGKKTHFVVLLSKLIDGSISGEIISEHYFFKRNRLRIKAQNIVCSELSIPTSEIEADIKKMVQAVLGFDDSAKAIIEIASGQKAGTQRWNYNPTNQHGSVEIVEKKAWYLYCC